MLPLIVLLALPVVSAQRDLVSGIGKLSVHGDNIAQFNLDVYASTVIDIQSSVNDGPNRTASVSVPAKKLFGVNVSLLGFLVFLLLTYNQYGNWLVSEPWLVLNIFLALIIDACVHRMNPTAWVEMGGEIDCPCSSCRLSEWSLSNYLGPEKADEVFKQRGYHFRLLCGSCLIL
jgi:hypothetical protein